MGKSVSATVLSALLKLWPKLTEEEAEEKIAERYQKGEEPTPPPKTLKTRYVDNENGRMLYVNENAGAKKVIFYIHGGAYRMDITLPHWQFIEKLVKATDSVIVVAGYRLIPFGTYKEAFDLIAPVYKDYCGQHPDHKVILMGDSAGGGLSLALAEYFRMEGIRLPDELVLISPWVDCVMDNEEIPEYESKDPFLCVSSLRVCAKHWAGDLDVRDWRISPIYGDLKGLHNVTVFTGTSEIFYPDITKFFHMLDESQTNEFIIGEEMNHVYPIFPIPEAKPAVDKVIEKIMR